MGLSREQIAEAMRGVGAFPSGKDVVAAGQFIWSTSSEGHVLVKLEPSGTPSDADLDRIASDTRRVLDAAARERGGAQGAGSGGGLASLTIEFVDKSGSVRAKRRFGSPMQSSSPSSTPTQPPSSAGHTPIPGLRPQTTSTGPSGIPGVSRIIAVGAGKGGVGKSTVALNLAVGLARRGHSVGLLDGDIYGPSMPTMLALDSLEAMAREGMLQPFLVHGIKCMTIGKLVDADKPLIWRGPMAHGAFKQLSEQTQWGELDYLIIDLPPGTGDVALTMAQQLKLTGAIVVCTPQKVAQDDAARAAKMFQQLNVHVLGVVENMSFFVGDDGKVYDIFGRGGAEHMAQRLGLPFLGSIPITMALRANSDKGDPTANFEGKDDAGKRLKTALENVVTQVENQVALTTVSHPGPSLTIR